MTLRRQALFSGAAAPRQSRKRKDTDLSGDREDDNDDCARLLPPSLSARGLLQHLRRSLMQKNKERHVLWGRKKEAASGSPPFRGQPVGTSGGCWPRPPLLCCVPQPPPPFPPLPSSESTPPNPERWLPRHRCLLPHLATASACSPARRTLPAAALSPFALLFPLSSRGIRARTQHDALEKGPMAHERKP